MKLSARIAGALFLLLSFLEVNFLSFGFVVVHRIVKPFLMPSLALSALLALLPEHRGRETTLLAIGMTFHFAGDVFLLYDGMAFIWFVCGLAAFQIGHFFYLAVLYSGMGRLQGWKEILCLVLPVFITPFAVSMFDVSGGIRIALSVYAMTLLTVTSTGVLWLLRGRKQGWRIIIGGLLFMFSDALIGFNTFSGFDFPLRHALVLATYLAAEWFLVSGMVFYRVHSSTPQAR